MLAAERFGRLLADLALTADDRARGLRAHRSVRTALQAHYYGHLSIHDHSRLIGAWAKGTEVRPPRPIDLLFVLPKSLRDRQWPASATTSVPARVLDDVKQVLGLAYGERAELHRDTRGITVAVDDRVVDVRPAFAHINGRYLLCDASGEGRFVVVDPGHEEALLRQSDSRSHGNTRDLIRMLKCWQAFCAVPLPSFGLELLAIEFLDTWPRAGDQASFYDWMIRDFFAFLMTQLGRDLPVPGAEENLSLGHGWLMAARSAHGHAAKACDCENAGLNADAWWEWEKIFGERIPLEA
jgi:Second Messenger Oligonucleotide or Dinucleotide Synthetase domain